MMSSNVIRRSWKTGFAVTCGDSLGIREQDPFWAKNAKMGLSTMNAKAETVATAPAFREAFETRRCLVPADAFYEWQKIDAKTKQPFAIGMKDGSPYPFAGLWERWKDAAAKERLRRSQSSPQTRMKWPSRCTIACTASCSGRIMTLGSLRKTRSVLMSIYCGVSRRSR
jgi:hypothetical protein